MDPIGFTLENFLDRDQLGAPLTPEILSSGKAVVYERERRSTAPPLPRVAQMAFGILDQRSCSSHSRKSC